MFSKPEKSDWPLSKKVQLLPQFRQSIIFLAVLFIKCVFVLNAYHVVFPGTAP